MDWVTPPKQAAWDGAGRSLASLKALDEKGRVTARGRALLRYPAPPRVAAVLEEASALGPEAYERACAMAAVFETSSDLRPGQAADLSALATDLLAGSREELSWEASEVFRQFKRLGPEAGGPVASSSADALSFVWLSSFMDRLAAREGEGSFYRLGDGRGALLPAMKDAPPLLIALDVRERAGGGQARQVGINLFLPFTPEAIMKAFPGECSWTPSAEFDERKIGSSKDRLVSRLHFTPRSAPSNDRKVAPTSAEKSPQRLDIQLRRPASARGAALARRLYPDMGYPEMSPDDWRLIYGEACAGRNTLKDIERVNLLPHIEGYLGGALAGFLDCALPVTKRLPSEKTGRFTYHETHPPELAARLGDFVKMTGTLALCEGRLPVTFDILAPNHRTVQKTKDLASFWANAYPTVKKELQRRYPRHPWP